MALPKIRPAENRRILYKDFPSSFRMNPVSKDLSVLTDENAVSESMKNLVMTNAGERLFQPGLGGNVQSYLFENASDPSMLKLLKETITDTIKYAEGLRVELIDVEVYGNTDEHHVSVVIRYYLKNSEDIQVASFILERVR